MKDHDLSCSQHLVSSCCVPGTVLTPTLGDFPESHDSPVTQAVMRHLRLTLTKAVHLWVAEPTGLMAPVPQASVLPCPLWGRWHGWACPVFSALLTGRETAL